MGTQKVDNNLLGSYRVKTTETADGQVQHVNVDSVTGLINFQWDEVQVSYPNGTQETYTFSFDTTEIGTVTVTYTDSTKALLASVIYTAS